MPWLKITREGLSWEFKNDSEGLPWEYKAYIGINSVSYSLSSLTQAKRHTNLRKQPRLTETRHMLLQTANVSPAHKRHF